MILFTFSPQISFFKLLEVFISKLQTYINACVWTVAEKKKTILRC